MKQILLIITTCIFEGYIIKTQNINPKENISFDSKNLLGNWIIYESASEWKIFYPELIFVDDSVIMIPTRGDTIIHCKYILKEDSLFFYLRHHHEQQIGVSRIIELTSRQLKLSNILSEIDDEVTYTRRK